MIPQSKVRIGLSFPKLQEAVRCNCHCFLGKRREISFNESDTGFPKLTSKMNLLRVKSVQTGGADN